MTKANLTSITSLHLQFVFQEGVGCPKASLTILETITYLKEVARLLVVSLMYRKLLTLSGLMVFCTSYFMNFDIKDKMWLALKDLYTLLQLILQLKFYMTALFPGPLMYFQGTEQGRIVAPFMYKVYINGLLTEINNHSFEIVINSFGTRIVFLNDPLSDEYNPTQWVSVSREDILHFLKNRVSTTKCLFSCLQHKNIKKHSKDEI